MAKPIVEIIAVCALAGASLVGIIATAKNKFEKDSLEYERQDNQTRAMRFLPAKATGPYEQAQADAALAKLGIPSNLAPIASAYKLEGSDRVGCTVVSTKASGQTLGQSKARTVADACAEAGAQYQKDFAESERYAKQPSFSKTPFTRSYYLASQAVPRETVSGDATKVLPLLEKANFPKDKEVVIVSYSNFDDKEPIKGCVLVGTMGTFKASSDSEVSACDKVIAMAKAAKT